MYAVELYRALSDDHSVQAAHDRGLIALEGLAIPAEKRPTLLVRDGVDANQVFPGRGSPETSPKSATGLGSVLGSLKGPNAKQPSGSRITACNSLDAHATHTGLQ